MWAVKVPITSRVNLLSCDKMTTVFAQRFTASIRDTKKWRLPTILCSHSCSGSCSVLCVCSVSQRWAAGTCLPAQIQLGGSSHTKVSTTGTTEFAGDIKWPNPELTHITVSQSLENFFIGFWDILSLNNFYNFRLIVFLFSQILCELPLILHKLSPFQYFYTEVFKEIGCVKWIIFSQK